MALLLSARRGWLPAGFTELEYLESSGTQYIDTGVIPNSNVGLFLDNEQNIQLDTIPFGSRNSSMTETRFYAVRAPRVIGGALTAGFGWGTWSSFTVAANDTRIAAKLNWLASAKVEYRDFVRPLPNLSFEPLFSLFLFAANVGGSPTLTFSGRIWCAAVSEGESVVFYAVPVLDSAGTPCMFDKISRQCFYNQGTGTFGYRVKTTGDESAPFSLRDPYYTAPSGVYARPSGDNQLEILADTEETTGDGWEWFANTGEAYEHFGISQEELLTNETTND